MVWIRLKAVLLAIFLILSTVGYVQPASQAEAQPLKLQISTDLTYSSQVKLEDESDYDINGCPDVIVTLTQINNTLVEIYVNDTRETGAYKWASALINLTGFDWVRKSEYNPKTKVWTDTGLLNYGLLTNYGLPSAWGEESNGYGFILFGAGSGDKTYRLTLPSGVKELKLYSGKGTNIMTVLSGQYYFLTEDGQKVEITTKSQHPYFKMNKWSGYSAFSADLIKVNKVTLSSNRLTWSTSSKDVILYPLNASSQYEYGGLEYLIVLKSKPSTNTLTTLVDTTNLTWYYQPALTAEEIVKGVIRPDDVVGSYAVYHSANTHNQYKTGKAFHIYRPKVTDSLGNSVWASFNSDVQSVKRLTVTLPQSFLDTAVYPLTIDPTFGYTTIGASANDCGYMSGYRYQLTEAGSVTGISIYGYMDVAASNAKMGIYNNSGTAPNAFKGATNALSVGTSAAWRNFAYASSVSLTAAYYHLCILWASGNKMYIYYDTGTDNWGFYKVATYPNFPDPAGTVNYESMMYSMYATYTTGQDYPRSISDTVSLTDSIARVLALARAIGDTFTISDSIARISALARSISDIISAVESISAGGAYPRSISDSILIVSAVARSLVSGAVEEEIRRGGALYTLRPYTTTTETTTTTTTVVEGPPPIYEPTVYTPEAQFTAFFILILTGWLLYSRRQSKRKCHERINISFRRNVATPRTGRIASSFRRTVASPRRLEDRVKKAFKRHAHPFREE